MRDGYLHMDNSYIAYSKQYREQRVQQGRVRAGPLGSHTNRADEGDSYRAAGCIQSILARGVEWLPLLNGP